MTNTTIYNPWTLAVSRTYGIKPHRAAQLFELADTEGLINTDTKSGESSAQTCDRICKEFDDWVAHLVTDSVVPGLCTACGYSSDEVEPDASGYTCDECGTPTVYSPLVLLGLI